MKSLKAKVLFFLPVLAISLFVLWPSFRLALTGDDYLGLWRYHYYIDGHATGPGDWKNQRSNWNNLNFFFTDYGPQDTFTAIIHSFVGFQPFYYYLISFLLRLLAAYSFFPIVMKFTKNKTAAYCSVLFFSVCSTGLETTDWSFNMPSYLAIAFLNIFLLCYVTYRERRTYTFFFLSGLLLYLTIIAQPIRMTFLPGLLILFECYGILRERKKESLKNAFLRISLFLFVAIFAYTTGYIGNSIGAGETLGERLNGGWRKVIANNFTNLRPYLEKGQYQLLAYPIAQFGAVMFPTHIIPPGYQPLTIAKAIGKIFIPSMLIFITAVYIVGKLEKRSSRKQIVIMSMAGIIWGIFSLCTYVVYATYMFNKSQFITMLLGGYVLLLVLFIFLKKYKDKKFTDGLVLAILLTILSFMAPWFRTPASFFESTGRYLIVPAAGLSLLIGIMLNTTKKPQYKKIFLSVFSIFLLLHMYASFSYIHHLSLVRDATKTARIRQSIPKIKNFGTTKEPLLFYFEPENSEVLHHALMFGFPVIIGDQYNFFNVWNMAYTQKWDEVVAGYTDGSSLKRFSIPIKKVQLENIYSFRLENDMLVNTTEESRKKLIEQTKTSHYTQEQ